MTDFRSDRGADMGCVARIYKLKKCEDCVHYEVCGYHVTEETDMSVEECAHGFKDAENYTEVVRCKDCAYANEDKELCDM